MKHPTSRMLHAYWDRLRGQRAAPERSEIEPGEIRNLLADSLVLEVEPAGRHAALRLAGTRLCALFGRELRGAAFAELWGEPAPVPGAYADHAPWQLIETVALDTVGLVAGLKGRTQYDESVDLELLLLPLRHRGRTQARMLGALSPHCVPAWLGLHPVSRMDLTSLRVLGSASAALGGVREDASGACRADLPLPANDVLPAKRGHLLVHQGGRT